MKRLILLAGIIALVVAGATALPLARQAKPAQAAAPSVESLMGTALHQEEVEGKFADAIATYRKVLAAPGATRAQQARAQFRIGACYERLGNTEATKAYEAVVRDYADLGELAKQAKARLTALGTPSAAAQSGAPNMRRVATIAGMSLDAYAGHLSPDGTKISGVDFDGNLIVRDVRTGVVTRLTTVDASKDIHDAAGDSVWSPDGKSLAYQWFLAGPPRTKEIRIIPAEGGKPRTLLSSTSLVLSFLRDWSQDGRYLLAYGGSKLMLVSTVDGSLRTLREFAPGSGGSEAGLSPDGRFLAFSARPRGVNEDSDLFVMPIDGGEPVAVAATAQSEDFVAWAPDGLSAIFSRRGGGGIGLWSVPIVDGRGVGEPALLWDALPRLGSLGLSRNGALAFVGERATLANLYVASVDFATGRVEKAPVQVGWVDRSALNPAWSADGTRLAFSTNMPSPAIGVLTMSTGQLKQIPLWQFKFVGSMAGLTWTADGRSLLFTAADSAQATGFYRLDVEPAAVTTLLSPANSGVPPFTPYDPRSPRDLVSIIGWSPDGRLVYKRVNHASTTREVSLSERRVADGSEREIFRSSGPAGIVGQALSPDGRSLAFVLNSFGAKSLEVLSLPDGTRRTVSQVKANATSASWTPDGSAVVLVSFQAGSREEMVKEAWVYPLGGGEPRKTGLAAPGLRELVVHPDRRQVAFTAISPEATTDIWLLENFLPKAAAKAGARVQK